MTADFRSIPATAKRRIFVSYHHTNDQTYYAAFSRTFAEAYDAVQDNSLRRLVDSDDTEYVMRRIREDHISGTSCTLVLCGAHTSWRKYVDWEIKATLDKFHGLIGVNLPTNPRDPQGRVHKPDRLQDNIDSGYAVWVNWEELMRGPAVLKALVEQANAKASGLIINGRPLRRRNGP